MVLLHTKWLALLNTNDEEISSRLVFDINHFRVALERGVSQSVTKGNVC